MSKRELFLLSPYTYPAQMPMTLADDDMAAWMHGWSALWHPAVLWGAARPPRVDAPYDYENPQSHHVYAIPESPPTIMPEDWPERVRSAQAVLVKAATDRAITMEAARQAYAAMPPAPWPEEKAEAPPSEQESPPPEAPPPETPPPPESQEPPQLTPEEIHTRLMALEADQVKPFLALGLGYLLLAGLSEAMEHENLLDTEAFWQDIQKAIAALIGAAPVPPEPQVPPETGDSSSPPASSPPEDGAYENYRDYDSGSNRSTTVSYERKNPPPWYRLLRSAAQRLQSAREVLYPVSIFLLDLYVPDGDHLDAVWPNSFAAQMPLNIIASASLLEKIQREKPELWQTLRQRVDANNLEVCGGCYQEREDNLLPLESQLWNLLKGRRVSEQLLGKPVEVFARKRFYAHPRLPLLLSSSGINRAIMITLDDSALPHYSSTTVSWPSPDGKIVDIFVRAPFKAETPEVPYNLGHYLYKTIREDHTATLAFLHTQKPGQSWLEDFQELSRFGPIFGEWVTFHRYFGQAMAGEHTSNLTADEFHFDYLSERVEEGEKRKPPPSDFPVSGFALHHTLRRQMDSCWTLAAMYRGLAGKSDALRIEGELTELEDQLESAGPNFVQPVEPLTQKLNAIEQRILQTFGDRLLAQAKGNEPGYLIINPCSYKRRITLELPPGRHPLPIEDKGVVRACQMDADKMRLVLEIPSLGFTWIPRSGPAGTPAQKMKMKLADERHVRNEFFEVEIDANTGGIASISDRKTQLGRLAQRLVFNPGSSMKMTGSKVTSIGPALGEVVTEGEILGDQQQLLARFRQRYRAWLGRPVLEMRIELDPVQPPAGYPWHAYFGSRFAWRDERAVLMRGFNGTRFTTTHTRPQTPDFLEIRGQGQNTVLFPCGLPFFQKFEARMVDLILAPAKECAKSFDIAIGIDREYPMLTSQGLISPVPILPVTKGPPHIGASGWLYHLDMPNLLLTSMRPGGLEIPSRGYSGELKPVPDLTDAVTVRLFEVGSTSDQAEFRTVRNPIHATMLNARGDRLLENSTSGDAVFLEVTPGDFNQLQIEFTQRPMAGND